MKLSLGPVLFYWDRQQTLDFYANIGQPAAGCHLPRRNRVLQAPRADAR